MRALPCCQWEPRLGDFAKAGSANASMDARTPTIDNPNLKEAVDMADITPVPSGVLLHEES